MAVQQIRDYLNPPQPVKELEKREMPAGQAVAPSGADVQPLNSKKKQLLEDWQKYMKNGEYFRSVEGGEEQNYSFIDGNKNNCKKKTGRASVLKKLRQKQAEIEKRGGKPVPQMEAADMERRRKQMMER